MALYVRRPRRDGVRIGRGLPSAQDVQYYTTFISRRTSIVRN